MGTGGAIQPARILRERDIPQCRRVQELPTEPRVHPSERRMTY